MKTYVKHKQGIYRSESLEERKIERSDVSGPQKGMHDGNRTVGLIVIARHCTLAPAQAVIRERR